MGVAPFKMLVPIGRIEDDFIFTVDGEYFAKCSQQDMHLFRLTKIVEKPFPMNPPIILNNQIICAEMGKQIVSFDASGSVLWTVNVDDLIPCLGKIESKRQEIKCIKGLFDNVVLGLGSGHMLCLDPNGSLKWSAKEISYNKFSISSGGIIYSIFRGGLKKVDVFSGEILKDERVDFFSLFNGKPEPILFQMEASSSHLWCGFLNFGLLAIDLKTGHVDWSGFAGRTVNRELLIQNNRVYVQTSSDGIGIDSGESQEYILEGSGGYFFEEEKNSIDLF